MLASLSLQCTVQVKLELGHRAQLRKKPTTEGFTHDWMVFVRGPEQCEIQHFVEKVVFRLHDSFPKPKRGECLRPRRGSPAGTEWWDVTRVSSSLKVLFPPSPREQRGPRAELLTRTRVRAGGKVPSRDAALRRPSDTAAFLPLLHFFP